jgi:hypothetical protein
MNVNDNIKLADVNTAYVDVTGDTMTGNLTFTNTDNGIVWTRGTDTASIKFQDVNDTDVNGRLEFIAGSGGTESFIFSSKNGGTVTQLLKIVPNGDLRVTSSVYATSFIGAVSGNADTASKLQTARTISIAGGAVGSASFDGSANSSISVVITNNSHTHLSANITDATESNNGNMIVRRDASGNFNAGTIGAALNGNASSATKLQTARTIGISGKVTGTATSFDGSAGITISTTAAAITSAEITDATNLNNGNAVVRRDASGNFNGGTINANYITTNNTGYVGIGDDVLIRDVSIGNTMGVIGQQNTDRGYIQFGTGGPTIGAITGGAVTVSGDFTANRVYNAVWNDLAEFFEKESDSEAGDVIVQGEGGVKKSSSRGDVCVVGVHSDTYGYVLGSENSEAKTPIGLSGRVNVKVREPLKIGDLLISDVDGFATRATEVDKQVKGSVFGKVLQNKTDNKVERIKILILNA